MSNQTKTNNLNYLIDPTFNKVNRIFVFSFENEDDRMTFSQYYTPNVEIKDFNVLINGTSLFGVGVKNKEKTFENIIEMSKNNDHTTGSLLDYDYFLNHHKLIAMDLSKQFALENPDLKQQFIFIGKEDEVLVLKKMIEQHFIIEKSEETTSELSQNSVSVT